MMKSKKLLLTTTALVAVFLSTPLVAQAQDPLPPGRESQSEEEPLVDQDLPLGEEELPPEEQEPQDDAAEERAQEIEDAVKEDEAPAGTRTIVLDGAVTLNYVFDNASESFIIKYSFHIEGNAAADAAVIKGEADIKGDVEGFLAKWPEGECKLSVTIPKIPFEMSFRASGEEKGRVSFKLKDKILETWESRCTFSDAPGKTFQTRGTPEEWLNKALQKARPPLNSISVKLDVEEATTTTFQISKQILKDPPIGTAEIEGTGVITVKPAGE
ncbi:MAG: hypothetical protein HY465_02345 [Deltaproteobacteria bacterium]|nr:hypothetical protein [Deltaproteobacteria bacterium]